MIESRASSLRKERKSPAVLRMALIKSLTHYPFIFIFEGIQDISFYEQMFEKCEFTRNYGHIHGHGKEQLLALSQQLHTNNEIDYCSRSYFFVDQDYDLFTSTNNNIFTLDAYSIENILVNDHAIKSILRDELKISAEHADVKDMLMSQLTEDYEKFRNIAREICLKLFISKTFKLNEPFPESLKNYIQIDFGDIRLKREYTPSNIDSIVAHMESSPEVVEYFSTLDDALALRGKYVFEFIKEWLTSAVEHIKSSQELSSIAEKIKLNQDFTTIRRLASATPSNVKLKQFLTTIP